ncbi:molecular chaperone [Chryseobacterium sp.]|uniref:fimbrial biogenesis chaperone n=1 Tax=Chryseobacterium sp. TaxID=1871047 RepID=UPI0011C9A9EF|nr:molecular chaperone [Chryseobacterium sp.]TXF77327.1 molecular chaperone [Chryseobacterium sp.]
MKSQAKFLSFIILLTASVLFKAQVGLTVNPPRNYYTSAAGESTVNKITVSNSSKTTSLTLTVSLNDWEYDAEGTNIMAEPGTLSNSCSQWISIKPSTYLTLAAGESQELTVTVTPPAKRFDSLDVHTALLFITQTNPVESYNEKGALVNISLRSGVKIYHRYNEAMNADVDFIDYNFDKKTKNLELVIENKGNIWTDGTVITEMVNQKDGTKYKLPDVPIYTMPKDKRNVHIPLPQGLKTGKYIANSTFSYGDDDTIKMAELTFINE